jgi:hypothetical protein
MVSLMSGYRCVEVALPFQVSVVPAFNESRSFDIALRYELAVLTAPEAPVSEIAVFLSANWTWTIRTFTVPNLASLQDSVPALRAGAPLSLLGGGVYKTCGVGSVFPAAVADALGMGAGAASVCALPTDGADVGTRAAVDAKMGRLVPAPPMVQS